MAGCRVPQVSRRSTPRRRAPRQQCLGLELRQTCAPKRSALEHRWYKTKGSRSGPLAIVEIRPCARRAHPTPVSWVTRFSTGSSSVPPLCGFWSRIPACRGLKPTAKTNAALRANRRSLDSASLRSG